MSPATGIMGWTGEHVRHAGTMVRQGANPAARVYESIGSDFFLALAPGWLNLGLCEGPGSEDEAEEACRRLVATLASALPAGRGGARCGNGLGTQDPVIADIAMAMTAEQIAAAARAAGLAHVTLTACGGRVIAPALQLAAARLARPMAAPAGHQAAARLLLWQAHLLWRRRIIDYLLLHAVRP